MPKGVYDRSASNWKPKPKKEYPPELVAEVRRLYESGLTMREVAEAVEASVKVIQRLMTRHGIARRPAAKRHQSGSANHTWKGDEAGYSALHLRVESARGKPQQCSRCDTTDPARFYEWANLTGHYEDVLDYARMCRQCHRAYDAARRKTTGERTSPQR